MKYDLSVIIPVYNMEDYLFECIESVTNQNLKNLEIICVNDGSIDNSLEILTYCAEKDGRIKIIDKPNTGYGHSVNTGIDAAQGKYIGIVEADDYISLSMYSILVHYADKLGLDWIKSDFIRFTGSKNKKMLKVKVCDESRYNRIIDPSEDMELFRFPMNTWCGVYSREFLNKHNIRHNESPGASFQDNGFWFQTMWHGRKCFFLPHPLYMNRRDNVTSSVLSREKVYCANHEYAFIRNLLRKNPELEEKYLGVFSLKKYHNYHFTLHRIHEKYRKEYLNSISRELAQSDGEGEIIQEYFLPEEWGSLQWIMRDPDEFYYEVLCKEIKVSVIMPVFNGGRYLSKSLDTIINQTLRDIEIICINDGSTDNSLSILNEYAEIDSRVIIISQDHENAGHARNRGIEAARGQFLSFLDCDDFFDITMLEKAYNKAVADNADICVYKTLFFDDLTKRTYACNYSLRLSQLPEHRPFSVIDIQGNPLKAFMGWAWDKLYRRSFVLNNLLRFQEHRTTNDLLFVFASVIKAGKITTVNTPLITHRLNNPSSLSATRYLSWECCYYALLALRDELYKAGQYSLYENHFINYALHFVIWNLNNLDHKAGALLFRKLKEGWFEELKISGKESDCFHDKNEYNYYTKIMSVDYEEYQAFLLLSLRHELDSLKTDLPAASDDLMYMRNSVSFKIGRAITFLPRKIRTLIKSILTK